jgi:hypothetical protein
MEVKKKYRALKRKVDIWSVNDQIKICDKWINIGECSSYYAGYFEDRIVDVEDGTARSPLPDLDSLPVGKWEGKEIELSIVILGKPVIGSILAVTMSSFGEKFIVILVDNQQSYVHEWYRFSHANAMPDEPEVPKTKTVPMTFLDACELPHGTRFFNKLSEDFTTDIFSRGGNNEIDPVFDGYKLLTDPWDAPLRPLTKEVVV